MRLCLSLLFVFSLHGQAPPKSLNPKVEKIVSSVSIARIAATLQRHGIDTVLSFDPAFDRVPGLTRLR